ncbi:putative Protein Red [Hypsibius exemplaris]|uniref:Protein Red n=1 Tax=Hypsibius exemplaris TaxID=2072580 RepID=A0A9X6NHL4_HYPEX|nr:putative Protein Red [Hypsibius exemplaris]
MAGSESVRLSNADFRKILMTPRSDKPATLGTPGPGSAQADKKAKFKNFKKRLPAPPKFDKDGEKEEADKTDSNYRDRAKERREHATEDHDALIMLAATSGYKAVAPDFQSGQDAAERRRKIIEESKYLGGDLEHTHLVKGLDYALLQKVRTELSTKEDGEEHNPEEEKAARPKKDKTGKELLAKGKKVPAKPVVEPEKGVVEFKTRMAKNVYNQLFNQERPQKNQLFKPGRMAFLWDLDDELGNWETPTTLIRSKAELRSEEGLPQNVDHDIVLEKLTQILSHMRQGLRASKKVRKDKKNAFADVRSAAAETTKKSTPADNIFDEDDGGAYKPTTAKLFARPSDEKSSIPYFKKPEGAVVKESGEEKQRKDREYIHNVIGAAKKLELKESIDQSGDAGGGGATITKARSNGLEPNRLRVESGPDSYAECYPGFDEAGDAAVDSDEEDDLSKMDSGNNKSLISRKKFENEEDFSNYMSQREALPKAAFQYGVKMKDGRKQGKSGNKNEKSKLNSEWSKISALIQKRKDGGESSGGGGGKRAKLLDA